MSTTTYRKPYPPEFRRDAVQLVRSSGRPMRQVARELGVSYESLRLWLKQAEIARARSLQTSDPQAAAELWSKVDRDVVDQAPWIAHDNPGRPTSSRAGSVTTSTAPQWGVLIDQLWVK